MREFLCMCVCVGDRWFQMTLNRVAGAFVVRKTAHLNELWSKYWNEYGSNAIELQGYHDKALDQAHKSNHSIFIWNLFVVVVWTTTKKKCFVHTHSTFAVYQKCEICWPRKFWLDTRPRVRCRLAVACIFASRFFYCQMFSEVLIKVIFSLIFFQCDFLFMFWWRWALKKIRYFCRLERFSHIVNKATI